MFLDNPVFKFLLSIKPYYFYHFLLFGKEVFSNLAGIIDATLIKNI
jgi:hypothetical protein